MHFEMLCIDDEILTGKTINPSYETCARMCLDALCFA
jgi:hypothetical protein